MKPVYQSEMSIIEVMNNDVKEVDNGRVFNYAINKKRAKSKLLKGAKRSNLDVELKPGCVNLRFCDGAFYVIVLPLIKDWNKKVNETIKIDDIEVKIIEAHAGVENSEHHVDTKFVVHANGDRLVLHAYNGTQNLMVQGKNYEHFALNCLQPYFQQKIDLSSEKIKNFNNVVKSTLDVKKPVKMKSDKPYKCAQCEVKPSTIGELRLHMKKCHTKPCLNSPKKSKALKTAKENDESFIYNTPKSDAIICDMKTIQSIMPEVEEFLYCNFCDFDTNSNEELKKHTDILHGQDTEPSVPEDGKLRSIQNLNTDVQDVDNEVGISETKNLLVEQPIICGECGKGFIEESKFTYHMATHVTLLDIKCEKCDFVTTNKEEIKVHMQTTHSDIKVDLRIEDQNVIICDECGYKCRLNIQYKNHKKNKHKGDGKYECKECDYTTSFIGKSWEHTFNVHINSNPDFVPKESENIILNMVAEHTNSIAEEMENLKKETKETINQFAKVLEVCVDKLRDNTNDKCKALGNTIDKLCDKITKLEESLTNDRKEKLNEEKKEIEHNNVKKMTYASAVSSTIQSPRVTVPPPSTTSQQPSRSKYQSKPKVLYVGDSVAHTADLRKLEKSHKCRIRSVRAYSSVYDNQASFPRNNFKDVVADNLENPGRENYDILVMSCPTVDITNMDHVKDTKDMMEEKAVESSKNMMIIAEQALARKSGSLKKVIIMEHPPRFDGVKSQLVEIANSALKQLHLKSSSKDMIVIGRHSLESSGGGSSHLARYQDYYTGRYDGVHLYGRTGTRDYTDSVNTMFLMALSDTRAELGNMEEDHTTCEQAQYQRSQAMKRTNRQSGYYRYEKQHTFSVPTQNRFSLFNQGN